MIFYHKERGSVETRSKLQSLTESYTLQYEIHFQMHGFSFVFMSMDFKWHFLQVQKQLYLRLELALTMIQKLWRWPAESCAFNLSGDIWSVLMFSKYVVMSPLRDPIPLYIYLKIYKNMIYFQDIFKNKYSFISSKV